MRGAFLIVLLAAAANAQIVLEDPAKIAGAEEQIDGVAGLPLQCKVAPIGPRFNFSLRLMAGYIVSVPMRQYRGAGHAWAILTRITPRDSERPPVYLASVLRLPPVPETKVTLEVGGYYWLGEGTYSVKWVLVDDLSRTCRGEWEIDARLNSTERKVAPLIPPNTVAGFWSRSANTTAPADAGTLPRITILLDVASRRLNSTVINSAGQGLLLDGLWALLEELPARSVKLVAFHLDGQREVYRKDGFTAGGLREMAEALETVQPSLVSYKALQDPGGALRLIEKLANDEIQAAEPSDAVIFLGPRTRYVTTIPEKALVSSGSATPLFFYIEYTRAPTIIRGGQGYVTTEPYGYPDSIESLVSRVKGKTVLVTSPHDFAKAIAEVKRMIAARKPN